MSQPPRFSIIIVNWNTCEYLAACLTSIHDAISEATAEIIVVDNGSRDGSADMVRRRFSGDVLIANTINRGFAGGVNDGLRVARGQFLLILNPDIILPSGVLEELAGYLSVHEEVGAVMPALRNEDGSEQFGYVRRLPTIMQVLLFYTALARWSNARSALVERYLEASRPPSRDPLEVEQIPGAFILTRRDTLDRVGHFEEAYRLFYEDVDWCFRVRANGLKLMMLPNLEVAHIGGRSFLVDETFWIRARYSVSLVSFFRMRKGMIQALIVELILFVNGLLVIMKNSLMRGGSDVEARRRATISRRTYINVLRLLLRASILRSDPVVLP
jgi:N-acetylglucosaminyl-diphospho-decaprenol L-rhamnosyltransferase